MSARGKIPRLEGYAGTLFKRAPFLSGDIRCYFGPGHSQSVFSGYYPPTDWPKAGTLLRVPQTVWLQLWFEQANDNIRDSWSETWRTYYLDTRYSTVKAPFNTGPPDYKPVYYGQGPFTTNWTNANKAEHHRIRDAFHEAKERIELIRPGRTWIQVTDWNSADTNSFDGYYSNGFVQFAAPPSDPGVFFGTDFFHIWVGHGLRDNFGSRNGYHTNPFFPDGPIEENSYYTNPLSRLVESYDKFQGHRTVLYHCDVPWIPTGTWPPDPERYRTTEPYPEDIVHQEENQDTYNLYELFLPGTSSYGFSHEGGSSSVSADSLVAMIADHFKFDPETGRDIE